MQRGVQVEGEEETRKEPKEDSEDKLGRVVADCRWQNELITVLGIRERKEKLSRVVLLSWVFC